MDKWKALWEQSARGCRNRGGQSFPLKVAPPAPTSALAAVEAQLGQPIPSSLADFFTGYSAEVEAGWQLPKGVEAPGLGGIFSGGIEVSLHALPDVATTYREWIDACFTDATDSYFGVWHNKFAFQSVPNGDMLAIDLASQAVIYLSHDDGEGHGFLLGSDFIDFVDRWSALGLVGPEDWQWLPFTNSPTSFLLPDSPPGLGWRSWLGLP